MRHVQAVGCCRANWRHLWRLLVKTTDAGGSTQNISVAVVLYFILIFLLSKAYLELIRSQPCFFPPQEVIRSILVSGRIGPDIKLAECYGLRLKHVKSDEIHWLHPDLTVGEVQEKYECLHLEAEWRWDSMVVVVAFSLSANPLMAGTWGPPRPLEGKLLIVGLSCCQIRSPNPLSAGGFHGALPRG